MNAYDIVKKYHQEHLLSFVDELTDEQKDNLFKQIEKLDFSVIDTLKTPAEETARGRIEPLECLDIPKIKLKEASYKEAGIQAIKAGKVAAVLLAGGMGTRLGSNDPKGMVNIGITRELYIFECLINNIMKVVDEAGTYIPLYIMTSDLNHEATTRFFAEKDYFGYPSEYINFFEQEMAPCSDNEGKIFLERKDKVSVSPNGNGGWFLSMQRAGLIEKARNEGVEWFNVFAVDNVLQQIADPVFVGATILEGKTVGAKVVRKVSPDEKVGVICLEDGHPSIVEYYELTEAMRDEVDDRGERVYNFGVILNYLFNFKELEEIVKQSLSYHIARKKIPYINEKGEKIEPDEPNGCKFEQLVLDMIYLGASCLPFEVERDKEFAPIKNKTGVDSVESARELLKKNGVIL